jgi:ribonuclease VapC
MVIDTSALVAILQSEAEADGFEQAVVEASIRLIPATCVLEARMVLVARRGERALAELDLWLTKTTTEIVPVDSQLVDIATQAWLTYGKGRHTAALNFADCLSYALAKRSELPLLYKGDDFSKTDIQAVSA